MTYIWEEKNRGISLYEKAILESAMLEASEAKLAFNGDVSSNPGIDLGQMKTVLEKAVTAAGGVPDENFKFEADGIQITPKSDALRVAMTKAIQGDPMFAKAIAGPSSATAAPSADVKEKIDTMLSNIKDDTLRNGLGQAVAYIYAGKMPNGADPAPEQQAAVAQWKETLEKGSPEARNSILVTLGNLVASGRIKVKGEGLYSVQDEKKSVGTNVQMPAMFDVEPDDSMWNEMIVNDFGFPIINLGHPAVAKIIRSDNPEEECPGDLKQFKNAVYGDKRLTAVFGKGGISRVLLGKMANLLTLGIAGATVDAGKRADRIIKELHEKGGRIAHRNLLVVDYAQIVDADPDNEELTIPVRAYNRARKQFIGNPFEVPVSALKQFYSAVDPVKSAKIYVEVATVDENLAKKLTESASVLGTALMEGKATCPKKVDAGTMKQLAENWVECLNRNGHPPYYVIKPKTDNKEVDVISNSGTMHLGDSKLNMVTMKVGEHKGAIFMNQKEIELYFSAT